LEKADRKGVTMNIENDPKSQISRGTQYVVIGIAVALSILVVVVTILVFVTDV
jgi:hypothetical protein